MVLVLRDRDVSGKRDGVASLRDELGRRRRCNNAATTTATVLLSAMAHDAECALDDVDLLGVFELAVDRRESAAADAAALVVVGELVNLVDDGQAMLWCWPVAFLRLARFAGLVFSRRAALRRRAKTCMVLLLDSLLEQVEFALQRGRVGAAKLVELAG